MATSRRHFSSPEKANIVRRHLIDKVPVSDLCDEYGLQPTQINNWQKQLFDNASAAFERTARNSKHSDAKVQCMVFKRKLKVNGVIPWRKRIKPSKPGL